MDYASQSAFALAPKNLTTLVVGVVSRDNYDIEKKFAQVKNLLYICNVIIKNNV